MRMKPNRWMMMVILGLMGLFLATLCWAETHEIKFQSLYPETHENYQQVLKPWMTKVEQMSGGRLKIVFFPSSSVVKEHDVFNAVKSGVLDIGSASTGRNPGKFPLSDAVAQPFLFSSSGVGSRVTWDLSSRYPEWAKEYAGTKLLWHWVSATAQIATTKKPVRTLEDLKGLKVIGWGQALLDLPEALGASPMNIPPPDTYLALERGMADGVHCAYAIMFPFKLNESVKYMTHADTMVVPFYTVMNEAKFKSLPPDLQKILVETTGAGMSAACGKSLDEGAQLGLERLKKGGMEQILLAEKEKERWMQAARPLREKWLKQMEGKGYKNIREIMAAIDQMAKEYGKK